MVEVTIENVVASTRIYKEIDIKELHSKIPESKYEPDEFPGISIRLNEPRTATILLPSGKAVCTGADSVENARKAIEIICKKLEKENFQIYKKPKVEIENIVASVHLKKTVDLNSLAGKLDGNVEYEPEQFPGLVYRLDGSGIEFLIFSSGKIVCTGGKTEDSVKEAIESLANKILSIV